MIADFDGRPLQIGDVVYYARKYDYGARGHIVKKTITGFNKDKGWVLMGNMTSKYPHQQLIKFTGL